MEMYTKEKKGDLVKKKNIHKVQKMRDRSAQKDIYQAH